MRPGITPAMKSLSTGSPTIEPMRMKPRDGGIMSPSVPPTATMPAEKRAG